MERPWLDQARTRTAYARTSQPFPFCLSSPALLLHLLLARWGRRTCHCHCSSHRTRRPARQRTAGGPPARFDPAPRQHQPQKAAEKDSTHIVAHDEHVQELQRAHDDEKSEKGIDQLGALGRAVKVVVPDLEHDLVEGGVDGQGGRLRALGGARRARRGGRRGFGGVGDGGGSGGGGSWGGFLGRHRNGRGRWEGGGAREIGRRVGRSLANAEGLNRSCGGEVEVQAAWSGVSVPERFPKG